MVTTRGRPTDPRRRAAGFALAEMLVCVALLAVILSAAGLCFAEIVRLRGTQERYNRRVDAADYLLRHVARDVRGARAFLAAAPGYTASADTVILAREGATVVYNRTRTGIERVEIAGGRASAVPILDQKGLRVLFDFEGAAPDAARTLATTVEWDEPPRLGLSHPVLSHRVALRNGKER